MWSDGRRGRTDLSLALRSSASSPTALSSTRFNSLSVYQGFISRSGRPRYIVNLSASCSAFFFANSANVGAGLGLALSPNQRSALYAGQAMTQCRVTYSLLDVLEEVDMAMIVPAPIMMRLPLAIFSLRSSYTACSSVRLLAFTLCLVPRRYLGREIKVEPIALFPFPFLIPQLLLSVLLEQVVDWEIAGARGGRKVVVCLAVLKCG